MADNSGDIVTNQEPNESPSSTSAAEHARFIQAMRESEAAVRAGHVQDLDEAFDEIRTNLGLHNPKIGVLPDG